MKFSCENKLAVKKKTIERTTTYNNSILNPRTPEQAEQVQPYFPGDLQYIFVSLHHSQYWFQLFNKKCDVNKTIQNC